jgi:hypothetical protein
MDIRTYMSIMGSITVRSRAWCSCTINSPCPFGVSRRLSEARIVSEENDHEGLDSCLGRLYANDVNLLKVGTMRLAKMAPLYEAKFRTAGVFLCAL